jgi:hypothetical protein
LHSPNLRIYFVTLDCERAIAFRESKRKEAKNWYQKWSKEVILKIKQRWLRALTLHEAIKKNSLLLLQFWESGKFKAQYTIYIFLTRIYFCIPEIFKPNVSNQILRTYKITIWIWQRVFCSQISGIQYIFLTQNAINDY